MGTIFSRVKLSGKHVAALLPLGADAALRCDSHAAAYCPGQYD